MNPLNIDQFNTWSITRDLPIKVAAIGDSKALWENSINFDTTILTPLVKLLNSRPAGHLSLFSRGMIQMVACCGISGDTSTGLIARDQATASATRKAIIDAAAVGAKIAIIQIGINDLHSITSATTGTANLAIVATTLANTILAIQRCYQAGMWPMFVSISGQSYGVSGQTNANIDAQNPYMISYNSQVQSAIASMGFGSYIDTFSLMANATTGYYNTGMSNDGLHPGQNGAMVEAQKICQDILQLCGIPLTELTGYYTSRPLAKHFLKLPLNSYNNLFVDPLFTKTSGQDVSVNTSIGSGTNTLTSRTVNIGDGVTGYKNTVYLDLVITPATFDGNGNASIQVVMSIPVVGATPVTPMNVGDKLAASFDFIVDDGSGGNPAGVASYQAILLFTWNSTTWQISSPGQDTSTVAETWSKKLDGRISFLPFTCPAPSAQLTSCNASLYVVAKTTTPYRIRIANRFAVKIPADPSNYASNPQMVANADAAAQSAAGSISTYTPIATGSFMIAPYLNVTAIATNTIQVQVTYTDENSTAQTYSYTALSAAGNAAYSPIIIRAKLGTVITVKTNNPVSGGTNTFDAGSQIIKL